MKITTFLLASQVLFATMSAFASYSQFVCISPENPTHNALIQPVITFTGEKEDYVTVEISSVQGLRQSWLIVCKEPLSAERQNFRAMVQTMKVQTRKGSGSQPREKRKEVVLIAPLNTYRDEASDDTISTNAINIKIELSLELAERAYIYIDYPFCIMDGGYFWSIDIPAYVKSMKARQKEEAKESPRKSGESQNER